MTFTDSTGRPAHRTRAAFPIIALAWALAACGIDSDPERGLDPEASPRLATRAAALRVCADGATVSGIDVSKWQGGIDWVQVRDAGIDFAFIRVSHGTEILDEYFVDNWSQAASVGVLRGAYQYFRPEQDAVAQADVLLDYLATFGAGELPPVIDVEETDDLDPATIADQVGRWMARVEEALGVRPIIYTGRYFWNDNVQTEDFAGYPLWIAHWGVECPNLPDAWGDWVFWQTSASGQIPGINGNVDTDLFNGDLEALVAFGTDPECRVDAAFSDCLGDTLRRCDDGGRLQSFDCAASGELCQLEQGTARCSEPAPPDPDTQPDPDTDPGPGADPNDQPDPDPDAGGPSGQDGPATDVGEDAPQGQQQDDSDLEAPSNPAAELDRFAEVPSGGLNGDGCRSAGARPAAPVSLLWLLLAAAVLRRGRPRRGSPQYPG